MTRTWTNWLLRVAVVAVAMAVGAESRAQIPEGFEMVRLTGFGLYSRPDINNRSEAIWSYSEPPSVSDIYLFSDGIIRRLTDDQYYEIEPSINDDRDYAYAVASDFFGTVDVAWNIRGQLTVYDAENAGNAHPEINNAGQVVWHDKFTPDGSDQRVFLFDGQRVFQVTFNGLCNHSPRINSCGEIVIDATDTSQTGNPSTIMMYEGGILAELTNGELRRSGPINNDNGQIVWHESDVDGLNDRILLWESGAAIPLVTEEDVAGSSISNSGDISYVAWNETKALYELKVYRASDQLVFTLPSVGFSHSGGWAGMNECGELVWRASPPEGGPPTLFMLRRTSPQGDFDHDCRIDAYDFSILEDCFTGSGVEPGGGLLADCTRADFDDDGDVDETDVSAFLEAAGGPAAPVPDCQAIALCGS